MDRPQDAAQKRPGRVGVEDDRRALGLDRPRVEHLDRVLGRFGRDFGRRLQVGEEAAAAAFAARRLLLALLGHDRDAETAGRGSGIP